MRRARSYQFSEQLLDRRMAQSVHFALMASRNEKCTVQSGLARLPRRKPNAEYRSREHLTEREVGRANSARMVISVRE
jgi:hypothetical protein